MKLSSLLSPDHIVVNVQAHNLEDAVREILSRAGKFHADLSADDIVPFVMRREQQGSTALERGVAIPHARIPDLDDFYLFVGKATAPLREKGIDEIPVDVVFLILASDKKNSLLLQTMAAIGNFVMQEEMLDLLRKADKPYEIWQVLDRSGVSVKRTLHARDLMRTSYLSVMPDMRVQQLLDLMFETGASEAVVTSGSGKILGVVTSAEILDAALPKYMASLPGVGFLEEFEPFEQFFRKEADMKVEQIMNRKPLIVAPDDPLIQVAFRMNHQKEQFAYVEEAGRFVGMIDRNDLLTRVLRA